MEGLEETKETKETEETKETKETKVTKEIEEGLGMPFWHWFGYPRIIILATQEKKRDQKAKKKRDTEGRLT